MSSPLDIRPRQYVAGFEPPAEVRIPALFKSLPADLAADVAGAAAPLLHEPADSLQLARQQLQQALAEAQRTCNRLRLALDLLASVPAPTTTTTTKGPTS